MSPTMLIGIALIPFAVVLAMAVCGRPTMSGLKLLIVVMPLQAFGAIEAGFTIPWSYLVMLFILAGIMMRGEFISCRDIGCKAIVVYWSIALVATAIGYLGAEAISTPLAENMRFRAGPLRSPLQYALLIFHFSLFFVVVNFVRNRSEALGLLKIHLWVGFVMFVAGVGQMAAYLVDFPLKDITWSINLLGSSATYDYATVRHYTSGVADFSTRATFFESLSFADYISSVLPITLALWMSRSRDIRKRLGLLSTPVVSILGMLALFFTLSRSGWGALVVALIVLAVYLSPRVALMYIPAAAVVTSAAAFVMTKIGFFSTAEGTLISIVGERFDLQRIFMGPRARYFLVLWDSFKDHPWLGLGAGRFATSAPAVTGSDQVHSAHGPLWLALADFGLLGFVALAIFFTIVVVRLHRAIKHAPRKSVDRIVMIGLFASLCALLFQSLFVYDRLQFYFVFLLGLGALYAGWYKPNPAMNTNADERLQTIDDVGPGPGPHIDRDI